MRGSSTVRPPLAVVFCCLITLGGGACARAEGGRSAGRSGLTVLYDADERVFGPYWSVDAWFLMFLPLVANGENGEYVPRLARSWEHSADFRVWTFHLRSDVRWHDGVPVTAHDVKFSIELAGNPDVLFDDPWHDLASITVVDDSTLTIAYTKPKDARNAWMVYWPKHLLEGLDPKEFYDWDFWKRPVGDGPYRYVRHVPKTMVELEANPDFFAGKPAVDRLTLKFGSALGMSELLSGNVDILPTANEAEIPKLAADPRFEVHYYMGPDVPWLMSIFWNHESPALGDARVRRALTLAIDRRELLSVLNLPRELRLTDAPFTRRQYHDGGIPAALEHDPERSADLLDEAGWRQSGARSLRQQDGQTFRFTAILEAGGMVERAAVYIQSALRDVGVDMEIQTLDMSVLRGRVASGDYDAAFMPFYNHVEGHLNVLGGGSGYARRGEASNALPGYEDVEAGRLLRSALETVDPAKVDSIYRDLWPRILDDMPITFLYPQVQMYVVNRRVRGLKSPERGDPILFMEKLWIDEEVP